VRVPILIGGAADAAVRRTVSHGEGWTAGGGGPALVAGMANKVRKAWHDGGREGEPRIAGLAYFGLGDPDASRASLRRYYSFLGDFADTIAENGLRTPDALRAAVRAFEDAGATEIVFDPTIPDVAEVDRLADAVL
jgi:alkanesulfonate monooxygenase SsuD/methylene tetrahydromethanopterin reductase-like flavin-dependent oxidoreductase (luciferase family)